MGYPLRKITSTVRFDYNLEEDGGLSKSITHQIGNAEGKTVNDLLEEFANFLRSMGYVIDSTTSLELVREEFSKETELQEMEK